PEGSFREDRRGDLEVAVTSGAHSSEFAATVNRSFSKHSEKTISEQPLLPHPPPATFARRRQRMRTLRLYWRVRKAFL
ncbi:hypothetical protein, partial [uncultured Halomonas sp.]|uniref:hypothetical protein n=1 Tax=uncultured Halomonas sp. TaxID=173971 RepID=UPI0026051CC1